MSIIDADFLSRDRLVVFLKKFRGRAILKFFMRENLNAMPFEVWQWKSVLLLRMKSCV
ncbi:hypothetical protein HNP81_002101 [Peribacillus huizhouensis]|uniref:Uncharacterized protein n=1 Tax=Peribacillus huizhouensis TaxID=1501239 RepID=A0ABR6CPF8_9BACI|nr:hypothetical protein [Peribacillus huizhouensis]